MESQYKQLIDSWIKLNISSAKCIIFLQHYSQYDNASEFSQAGIVIIKLVNITNKIADAVILALKLKRLKSEFYLYLSQVESELISFLKESSIFNSVI